MEIRVKIPVETKNHEPPRYEEKTVEIDELEFHRLIRNNRELEERYSLYVMHCESYSDVPTFEEWYNNPEMRNKKYPRPV